MSPITSKVCFSLLIFAITLICGYAYAETHSELESSLKLDSQKATPVGVLYFQEDMTATAPCGLIIKSSRDLHPPLDSPIEDSPTADHIRENFARHNIQECNFAEYKREEIELTIQMTLGGSIQVASSLNTIFKTIISGGIIGCLAGTSTGVISSSNVRSTLGQGGANFLIIVFAGLVGVTSYQGVKKIIHTQPSLRKMKSANLSLSVISTVGSFLVCLEMADGFFSHKWSP